MEKHILEIEDLKRILPQRYPFLMIDRVIEASPKKVIAIKNVSINEEYFKGHFPDEPVMPGALIIEAMAQAAIILYYYKFNRKDKLFLVFVKARFLRLVSPADQMKIIATPIKLISGKGIIKTEVFINDLKSAEAEIGFSTK